MINSSIRLHFKAVSRPERGNRLVGNLVTTASAVLKTWTEERIRSSPFGVASSPGLLNDLN